MKFIPLAAKLAAQKRIGGHPILPGMFEVDQTFVLSPSVALEVEKIANNSKIFIHPQDLHLPYPRIYVELPITEEIRNMRRDSIGTDPISRVGAIISEVSEGVFSFWPSWEFTNGGLGFGLTCILVNVPDELAHARITMFADRPDSGVNLMFMPCMPVLKHFHQSGAAPEEAGHYFKKITDEYPAMLTESYEEISPLLIAWATLVNCRTGLTKTHIKRVKPKAAGKRSAILNGTSYTVVTLNAVENVNSDGVISARADLSAHFVRGHFKQRSTGLFWWQPFVRGIGQVKRREAYFVRDTAEEKVPA